MQLVHVQSTVTVLVHATEDLISALDARMPHFKEVNTSPTGGPFYRLRTYDPWRSIAQDSARRVLGSQPLDPGPLG